MLKNIKKLLSLKAIAEATGIPYDTVRSYSMNARVIPDQNKKKITKYLKSALKKIAKTF